MIIILILLLIVLVTPILTANKIQSGGMSTLSEDISQGVPVSYSGQINTPGRVPRPQKQNSIYTYYGHGIPLITTKPGPIQNPLLLPHNMGLRCAPECCPSPYSCDHGCLCADLRHMK